MTKLKMTCTDIQWDGLHISRDKSRSTSKTVTVDKAALVNLLKDHALLQAYAEGQGVKMETEE